jgi:pSer/pThr/pTyr-binding forkhead associated (FHA) protein
MAFLVREKDGIREQNNPINLERETIIGREKENAVFIDDPKVSRQHAKIVRETDDSYYVIDLGSRNGTTVNNEKIFRRKLTPFDRIGVGKIVLIFNEESVALPVKQNLGSEIQKIVQNMEAPVNKNDVKAKEVVAPISNESQSKEVSGWVKAFVFISFLLFFIVILFWAKWAGEKLIVHVTKSHQANNIPSSIPPK